VNFADVLAEHSKRNVVGTVVVCRHSIPIDFGVVDISPDLTVVGYREKPLMEEWVSAGIYAVDPVVWDHIPPGEYLDMPTLIAKAIAHSYPVACYRHDGPWLDIGTIPQYQRAEEVFHRDRALYLPDELPNDTERALSGSGSRM
jgi:mannose-1-phosphate guanylyltransferase